jgi:sphingomyelin phosphodiesterase acid-like 3
MSKIKKRKVLVTAHVPPGYFERQDYGPFYNYKAGHEANEVYVDIVTQTDADVIAQIFGHTHTDTFRMFYGPDEPVVKSVAFFAPSITPLVTRNVGTNPGTRLYHYHSNAGHLQDYDQYFLDLKEANNEGKTDWKKLYSFTDAYGVKDMSFMNVQFAHYMIMIHEEIFKQSYQNNTLMYNNGKNNAQQEIFHEINIFFTFLLSGNCDAECEKNYKCALTNIKVKDMKKCLGKKTPSPKPKKLNTSWLVAIMSVILVIACGFTKCYCTNLPNIYRHQGTYHQLY